MPSTQPHSTSFLIFPSLLLALLSLSIGALSTRAHAEALRLADPTPRWIEVSFEISPRNRPGQLDRLYTPPLRAWFEPLQPNGSQLRRIVIPGSTVERHLLVADHPVAGSFSDYEWRIDARTGEVESAKLQGSVWRKLDLGIASARVKATLDVDLSTLRAAGFKKPRSLFGLTIHRWCTPSPDSGCTAVQAIAFDPERGYVNAVGPIAVRSSLVSIQTFGPIGEAIFREAAKTDGVIAKSGD